MKNRNLIKYIVHLIFFLIILYLNGYLTKQQVLYQKTNFESNFMYLLLLNLIRIMLGILLGLEYILNEIKKNGSWSINIHKIIFLVIPFIYLSISNLFFNSNTLNLLSIFPVFLFQNDFSIIYSSQMILGFFIITSFYKK